MVIHLPFFRTFHTIAINYQNQVQWHNGVKSIIIHCKYSGKWYTVKDCTLIKYCLKCSETTVITYRNVVSRNTCYYSENQIIGGATNQDMSLNETCFYSKIQKIWILKVFFAWISKVFFEWI